MKERTMNRLMLALQLRVGERRTLSLVVGSGEQAEESGRWKFHAEVHMEEGPEGPNDLASPARRASSSATA
jgi:hypothetical protein